MVEILRQNPQDPLVLLLLLLVAIIYVFQYVSDSRKFVYFYKSLYTKQYHLNYGRYSRLTNLFMVLLSLQAILIGALILAEYLAYCSYYVFFEYKFTTALFIILAYLAIKWLGLFLVALLFDKNSFYQEFVLQSAHYANLFFTPLIIVTSYLYLKGSWTIDVLSVLLLIALLLLLLSKVKLLLHFKKQMSLGLYYIILYLCTFELAPFLWLLISVKC